ncbi:MAG: DUF4845 domain-containing protein [Burkholderiales bacterium]|nr:MAG: DUF4845 domain-containing protein [Burkholderiales bacterium]
MQDRINSRRQAGLGLISLIFIGLIIVALLIIGAKLVPAITEYLAIEKAIKQIRIEASTVPELRKAFDRYAVIDDIKSISAKDLDITKESDKIVISYAYTYQIPIADNVRLVIDFAGTTSGRPKAD